MTDVSLADIFALLWPWSNEIAGQSHSGIIKWFVTIILLVLSGTLLWIAHAWSESNRSLKSLEQIGEELTADGGSDARRRAEETAKSKDENAKHLWLEFDETLVTQDGRTTNTVPAEEFFSLERIAPKIVGSRALATMPSILTALGLLGTFIGLAVGLNGLNLSSTVDVDTLRGGIESMVAGAALGFTASVWGVASSLVVNIVEKSVAGRLGRRTIAFRRTVDRYLEQHSPETALVGIERHTRDSASALEELHEKIGTRLQDAVRGMSVEMQEALSRAIETSMAPSMNALADRASSQSAEVFESLIGRFADGFRALGEQQASEMTRASESIGSAMHGIREAAAAQSVAAAEQAETFRRELSELITMTSQLVASLEGSMVALTRNLADAAARTESSALSLSGSSGVLDEVSEAFAATGVRLGQNPGSRRDSHEPAGDHAVGCCSVA